MMLRLVRFERFEPGAGLHGMRQRALLVGHHLVLVVAVGAGVRLPLALNEVGDFRVFVGSVVSMGTARWIVRTFGVLRPLRLLRVLQGLQSRRCLASTTVGTRGCQ